MCVAIHWLLGVLFFRISPHARHSGARIKTLRWIRPLLGDAGRRLLYHAILCNFRLENIRLPHIRASIFTLCIVFWPHFALFLLYISPTYLADIFLAWPLWGSERAAALLFVRGVIVAWADWPLFAAASLMHPCHEWDIEAGRLVAGSVTVVTVLQPSLWVVSSYISAINNSVSFFNFQGTSNPQKTYLAKSFTRPSHK